MLYVSFDHIYFTNFPFSITIERTSLSILRKINWPNLAFIRTAGELLVRSTRETFETFATLKLIHFSKKKFPDSEPNRACFVKQLLNLFICNFEMKKPFYHIFLLLYELYIWIKEWEYKSTDTLCAVKKTIIWLKNCPLAEFYFC